MKFNPQHFLRAVILAAFTFLFIKLHITGDIYKYINPKYEDISKIAAAIFLFFFFIQLFRVWEVAKHDHHEHDACKLDCNHDHDHDHGYSVSFPKKLVSYSIIIFPLVTGFSLAPAVLDSSIAAKKGVMFQGNAISEGSSSSDVSNDNSLQDNSNIEIEEQLLELDEIPIINNNYMSQENFDEKMKSLSKQAVLKMEDSIFEPYYEKIGMEPQKYEGRKISLMGFVYKEEGLNPNQVVVSRFLVTHCIADASIIGFLTEFQQEVGDLEEDTWLELEGTLTMTTYNGLELPMIQAEKWTIIEQPEEPYVYPVLTRVVE
ncbi:TIGR03943 family putative permease subunit [Bacillus sp. Marseille-P3661]|uniref:TIGR03943 family putative permease subunit n=1 Tax=Bacillus sp. Marseille-P3661 TaxID=1936234 RepID=UPI000C8615CB|nr:TIGR03943 family protein [Bacillus sp. Marseille-P3661]